MINWMVAAANKAEEATQKPALIKEVDECVVSFLRARMDWGRVLAQLEAQLEGRAQEVENLQHYCQAPCQLRKAKRIKLQDDAGDDKVGKAEAKLTSLPSTSITEGLS
jgi:hypothetical protein